MNKIILNGRADIFAMTIELLHFLYVNSLIAINMNLKG